MTRYAKGLLAITWDDWDYKERVGVIRADLG